MEFKDITEEELDHPTLGTVLRLVRNAAVLVVRDRVGAVLGSAFLLLMLWGPKGTLPLLGKVWSDWRPSCHPDVDPGCVLPHASQLLPVPWDQEWITFFGGFVLLVLIPIVLIKVVYKERLSDFGLGLPPRDRWGLSAISALVLLVPCLGLFYLGSQDPAMQREYPLYHGHFASLGQFAVYQLGYLAFFIVIEFTFRGYLLFGLYRAKDTEVLAGVTGVPGPLVFGSYAILLSMLSYTAWHLPKPMAEAWGTLAWGIATGAIALATRSIWPIVAVHWLLNVYLDYLIVTGPTGAGVGP